MHCGANDEKANEKILDFSISPNKYETYVCIKAFCKVLIVQTPYLAHTMYAITKHIILIFSLNYLKISLNFRITGITHMRAARFVSPSVNLSTTQLSIIFRYTYTKMLLWKIDGQMSSSKYPRRPF